jgi:TRAP-type C4-dicarboxylate transport system permease small subunit
MHTIKKVADAYNIFEKYALIVMMMAMVIVIFAQVVSRYVFGHALFWSESLGKFIFVWMSWLGVSAGLKEKEHIQVKLFPDHLKKKGRNRSAQGVYLFVNIFWFATSVFVAWYGWKIVQSQLETNVYDPSTMIPMWAPYLCVPMCSLIVCLRLSGEMAKNLYRIVKNASEDEEDKLPIDAVEIK